MSKLPLLSALELCKFLEKQGFVAIRQKGSHRFYEHPDGRTTVVPIHSGKDIGRGLFNKILDEIEMNREEFMRIYYKK